MFTMQLQTFRLYFITTIEYLNSSTTLTAVYLLYCVYFLKRLSGCTVMLQNCIMWYLKCLPCSNYSYLAEGLVTRSLTWNVLLTTVTITMTNDKNTCYLKVCSISSWIVWANLSTTYVHIHNVTSWEPISRAKLTSTIISILLRVTEIRVDSWDRRCRVIGEGGGFSFMHNHELVPPPHPLLQTPLWSCSNVSLYWSRYYLFTSVCSFNWVKQVFLRYVEDFVCNSWS